MTHQCRRRRGLALRLYRGAHRGGAWTVDGLAAAVAEQAGAARRLHVASLRRVFDPSPIFLGPRLVNVRFYGGLPDPTDPAVLRFTFAPADSLPAFPALVGDEPAGFLADDAPTGPIFPPGYRWGGRSVRWQPR